MNIISSLEKYFWNEILTSFPAYMCLLSSCLTGPCWEQLQKKS